MLSIQPTERYTGITLSGDYFDFDQLVTAIATLTGDENRYFDFQGARSRIVKVCMDIRKAMKGEKNVVFVSNGMHKGIEKEHAIVAPSKNVYYSVEILLPELIFMTAALSDFIWLHEENNDVHAWDLDAAAVHYFQAIVLAFLKEHLSEKEYDVFEQTLASKKPLFYRYASQYVDVLNIEFIHLDEELRKQHIATYSFRIIGEDEGYQNLKKQLLNITSVSKNALHELPLQLKYPKEIEW